MNKSLCILKETPAQWYAAVSAAADLQMFECSMTVQMSASCLSSLKGKTLRRLRGMLGPFTHCYTEEELIETTLYLGWTPLHAPPVHLSSLKWFI